MSLSNKITYDLYKLGCEDNEAVQGLDVKDVKATVYKLIQEIERIRRLPEQQQEWKGYRNLPNFIKEIFGEELI